MDRDATSCGADGPFPQAAPSTDRDAAIQGLRLEVVRKQKELRAAIAALIGATGEDFPAWAPHLSFTQVANCRVLPSRYHTLEYMPRGAVCAEIGTQTGYFAKKILEMTEPLKLHLIDLDLSQLNLEGLSGPIGSGQVELHQGQSADVLDDFKDEYFDWIYIDGDHSYEGVWADIERCSKKVRSTGFLIFNDFTPWAPGEAAPYGIMRSVQEFCVRDNWEFAYLALQGQGFHDVCIRKRIGAIGPR